MRPARRAYQARFRPAMLAYVAVLFAVTYALRHVEQVPLRVLLALAPMLPVAFAASAMVRFVRDSDELEQRVALEALSMAALLLTTITFALGLLAAAGVVHVDGRLALFLIMPGYIALYGGCRCLAVRRYR
ncbi:MAG TPA: hypothetical protein VLK29_02125 [Luteimonas sp.]|nr:hypothetical protein [Luteimonas sp.]